MRKSTALKKGKKRGKRSKSGTFLQTADAYRNRLEVFESRRVVVVLTYEIAPRVDGILYDLLQPSGSILANRRTGKNFFRRWSENNARIQKAGQYSRISSYSKKLDAK